MITAEQLTEARCAADLALGALVAHIGKVADTLSPTAGPGTKPEDQRWAWCMTLLSNALALLMVENERRRGASADSSLVAGLRMIAESITVLRQNEELVQQAIAIIERPERADA